MRAATIAFLCSTLLGAACSEEDHDEPTLAIGPRVYEMIPAFCSPQFTGCEISEIYRNGTEVQLLLVDDGEYIREVRGDLRANAAETLDLRLDELATGAEGLGTLDPDCFRLVDRPWVTLTLQIGYDTISLSYPWACAPSGLAEVDRIYGDLVVQLGACDDSDLVEIRECGE